MSKYPNRYKNKKTQTVSYDELKRWLDRVRVEPRVSGDPNLYLGNDPIRDSSLITVLWYTGLRITEIVGDRERTYRVISEYAKSDEGKKLARAEMPSGEKWMTWWNKYWRQHEEYYDKRTSPAHDGILGKDIRFRIVDEVDTLGNDVELPVLFITAKAKKHGKRDAPLQLCLNWAYMELVEDQWNSVEPNEPVWGGVYEGRREYVWKMLKEIDQTVYPHFFRFNRASLMAYQKPPLTTMLAWFGWKRIETASAYLERGGQSVNEGMKLIGREVRIGTRDVDEIQRKRREAREKDNDE